MIFKKKKNESELIEASALKRKGVVFDSMFHECAIIEFSLDGTITNVSSKFSTLVGYEPHELLGKHHRTLCSPQETRSLQYERFWESLASGTKQEGSFCRVTKDNQVIYLEATYIPLKDDNNIIGVMKIAQDVTTNVAKTNSDNALITAINRSNAVIEFSPDGHIISANKNFVSALGYSSNQELVGQAHAIFCFDDFYKENPTFWSDLEQGHVKDGLFKRRGRSGNTVWIEATYNPIFDQNNKVIKVVKVASDVTQRMERQLAIQHAAEIAQSTSVETAQVSLRGVDILESNITNSEKSLAQVQLTSAIIEELNNQSAEITKIVSTIKNIADQTNLLALNAAIEAARAGDKGRGFAVVADEVRSLASNTTSSTEEIAIVVDKNKALVEKVMKNISQISDDANVNANLIREASTIIEEILKGANYVSEVVGDLVQSAN
ncbi:methyl-accepting chemotaxis protein [Vibrio fluvialis]|nr:methyl-accepting chemotaxis protein [Vibrio fluvialis]